MKLTRAALGVLTAMTATTAFAAPALATPAESQPGDGTLVIGPGSPIRVPIKGSAADANGVHIETGMCSLGVPGTLTDPATGESKEVILTAGHCIVQTDDYAEGGLPQMSDTAYIPTDHGDVKLGTFDRGEFDMSGEGADPLDAFLNANDFAFIVLDPAITPTRLSDSVDEYGRSHGDPVPVTHIEDYGHLERGEVSADNFGQPICTDGSRTGRQCGYQVFRARNGVWAVLIRLEKGDSGGSAFNPDTGAFIGVNSMAIGPINRIQPADSAIEEAYGIPDGQVNDYFRVAPGTGEHSATRTIKDDEHYVNAQVLGGLAKAIGEGIREDARNVIDDIAGQAGLPQLQIAAAPVRLP